MRFARRRLTSFAAVAGAIVAACSSGTAPTEETASGCVTDFACPSGQECGVAGCQSVSPSIRPHIQTASGTMRPYLDPAEADFRAANYDLLINHVYGYVERIRSINPHARMFEYINIRYHYYDEPDNKASAWAAANGYDPEDMFLHYRQDTDVTGWESRVLVPGYPAGHVPGWNPNAGIGDPPASATTRSESRAFNRNDGAVGPLYMANIENPAMRRFLVHHIAGLVDGSHWGTAFASGHIDGIMADIGVYYAQFGEGMLWNTDEYYGEPMVDTHPYSRGFETLYPYLATALEARFGQAIDIMPNYGHVYFLNYDHPASEGTQRATPWAWAEVWLMYHGTYSPTSGGDRCITWEKDYENAIAAIVRETRRGSRRILGARDKPRDGVPGSDRGKIFMLALYYLVHNENTWFLYETVNNHGMGVTAHLSEWNWNPAVEFDIGQPEPVPDGLTDFDGRSGTTEHYVFAQGSDPWQPQLTYRVFARRFSNALVLAKMLPEGSITTDLSITTHQLDGSYAILQADGTLGAIVTSIDLRNNEGAILIPMD
jgi:hypothetical protein